MPNRLPLLLGLFSLLAGYLLLLAVEPMGRNLPGFLSPVLIVTGFALVAVDAVRKQDGKRSGRKGKPNE